MRDTLRAEWIKLWSVRSPYACVAGVAVVTLALALAIGTSARAADEPLTASLALSGLLGFGLIILMAMAVINVSGEYGTGTIRVTFTVLRGKGTVLAAKAVLLAAVSGLTAAVLTPAALYAGFLAAGQRVPWDGSTVRLLWGVPLVAALSAVVAVAAGVLIRRTAGAVALVVIWPLLIEGLTTLIPEYGPKIVTYLPFTNAHMFLGDPQGLTFAWSPAAGLAVFAATVAAVTAVAGWVVRRRDS